MSTQRILSVYWNDVMHGFIGFGQKFPQRPGGLPNPMFIFHKPEPYIALTKFAKAHSGRDGNVGFFQQDLGKLQ